MTDIIDREILELVWDTDTEYGYFPVDKWLATNNIDSPYDTEYFTKHKVAEATELSRKLHDFRLKLVNKYTNGVVVDVGIGSGQFVEYRNNQGHRTYGLDVNPLGLSWLEERGLLASLNDEIPVATFFHSLEHMQNYSDILDRVSKFAIVSLPIFRDYNHILTSKHFRKDQHYHYFGHRGFVSMMWGHGLRLIEQSDHESELGLDGVRTFVFRKVS